MDRRRQPVTVSQRSSTVFKFRTYQWLVSFTVLVRLTLHHDEIIFLPWAEFVVIKEKLLPQWKQKLRNFSFSIIILSSSYNQKWKCKVLIKQKHCHFIIVTIINESVKNIVNHQFFIVSPKILWGILLRKNSGNGFFRLTIECCELLNLCVE